MTNWRSLHFSLGPVQGFVAQARRTRDFWAGSFLLSYLAGCAMVSVLEGGGEIVFPAVGGKDDELHPLLKTILKVRAGKLVPDGPTCGDLPNRFQARIPADFDPEEWAKRVKELWHKIASAVWDEYVEPVAHLGRGTAEIWKEQVQAFWEIMWAIGDDSDLLDRRKNWRSHLPPGGRGEICSMMGHLQEISGYCRARERQQQDGFWQALEQRVSSLDLQEGERLSAIALIKRLFPRVAEQAIGWKLPEAFPSTSYMAAVHWLAKVSEDKPELAVTFASVAGQLKGGRKSYGVQFCGLETARKKVGRTLLELDGNCFFTTTLTNDRLWPEETRDVRGTLTSMLKDFGTEPSPFYAFLLMDGDRMGALLRDYDAGTVSKALKRFSLKAPGVIKAHNGVPVYVGGDDVLAILPLEDALPAAVKLRTQYQEAFARELSEPQAASMATISAAIVYAHHHAPLKLVLERAHRDLEEKAKNETGRDALAVTVWKTGGPAFTWSTPWKAIILENGENLVDILAEHFGQLAVEQKFTSSYFYNLSRRFKLFGGREGRGSAVGSELEVLPGLDPQPLLVAEYLKSRKLKVQLQEVEERVTQLLKLCYKSWRDAAGQVLKSRQFTLEGALLVKFLATKGVEK